MIELGTKLFCKEFGTEVTVTGMVSDFVEYVGDCIEGSIRESVITDFFHVGDNLSQGSTSGH